MKDESLLRDNKFIDTRNNEKRCHPASRICSGTIFKQFILNGQEGFKSPSCNKFEIPKQFHFLSAIQDGKNSFYIEFPPKEQFFDKNRFER